MANRKMIEQLIDQKGKKQHKTSIF